MIKVSVLTIGDEICIGQIINSNAAWIASKCTEIGCKVIYHSAVGDEREIMLQEIARLNAVSDVIIITGGLGPTHDDITKPVLCEYFDDFLISHKPTLDYLENWFKSLGRDMLDSNKGQASIPSKCKPLHNPVGTAPGMLFVKNNKAVISLPGVPREMAAILDASVIPYLINLINERSSDVVLYKTLNTAGIFESILAQKLGDTNNFLGDCTLAFLPSYKGVRLRIGCESDSFKKASLNISVVEKHIMEKAGEYVIGSDKEALSETIGKILKENELTVAVAESCTGGLLGADFTDISGSSNYFKGGIIAYSNDVKEKILGIEQKTIINNGAVSEEVAIDMAIRVREYFNTDYGISITGIAGPTGGTMEKPVGTVWIGLADSEGSFAERFVFGNDRTVNRERSVGMALTMLLNQLKSLKK